MQSLRWIKEWSDIPRRFHSGPRLNFNLIRTSHNRLGSGDKPRPPLLNVRTDGMRQNAEHAGLMIASPPSLPPAIYRSRWEHTRKQWEHALMPARARTSETTPLISSELL